MQKYNTYLRPETFSSMKLTTVLPNTKLENIVKRPAIAATEGITSQGGIVLYNIIMRIADLADILSQLFSNC